MSAQHGSQRAQRVMVTPINLIFKHLQSKTRVSIWLYDDPSSTIEGVIAGFDEFMNVVLEDAVEVKPPPVPTAKESRSPLGKILLKGDNITLIANASPATTK